MTTRRLLVLKENDDKASETYLNMIKRNAEEENIEVCVFDDLKALTNELIILSEVINDIDHTGVLVMQPFKNVTQASIAKALETATNNDSFFKMDIDNVTGLAPYEPATAEGICNHIIQECPERRNVIGVIGRGTVGSSVIKQLMKYGYTVIEMNSKTFFADMFSLCCMCDVLVGLSTSDGILNDENRLAIDKFREDTGRNPIWYIDAGKNFDFEDRSIVSKCGKWTREVLFSRL